MADLGTVLDCYDALKKVVAFVNDMRHAEKERASLLDECEATKALVELVQEQLETLPNHPKAALQVRNSIDDIQKGLNSWVDKFRKKEHGLMRVFDMIKHNSEKEAIEDFLVTVGRMKASLTLLLQVGVLSLAQS